jgi:hypothetical protein
MASDTDALHTRGEAPRVIPRLAERAEGSLRRSPARANQDAFIVIARPMFGGSRICDLRSLAVSAARDDTRLQTRSTQLPANQLRYIPNFIDMEQIRGAEKDPAADGNRDR